MSVEANDLKGTLVLAKLAKPQHALAVLRGAGRLHSTLQMVGVGVAVGVSGYFVAESAVLKPFVALVSGLVAGMVVMSFEQDRMRRLLDAVVALIDLDDVTPGR